MDLSKRVVYDAEFPVTILSASDSDVGKPVVFYVKSMRSKSIQKIERDGRNKLLVKKRNRGDDNLAETDIDAVEATERSKVIASLTKWEWNGNSFGDLGKDPEFTPANIAAIVDHENGAWIVDLLYAGSADIENFTQK